MINNRQAGRRRGRNNPRPNGGGGNNRGTGDSGNRIDNRARGNATQLLEKYRNLARDAQLAGDRVNAEYYLQFADHYFRVLADNRARQEEQQQRFRRNDDNDQDSFDSDDDSDDSGDNDDGYGAPRQDNRPARNVPPSDEAREQASDDGERNARPRRSPRIERSDADDRSERVEADRPERTPRRPRIARVASAHADSDSDGGPGLSLTALPPAIGRPEPAARATANDEPDDESPPKRRRGRPPRAAQAAE